MKAKLDEWHKDATIIKRNRPAGINTWRDKTAHTVMKMKIACQRSLRDYHKELANISEILKVSSISHKHSDQIVRENNKDR